ncbi:MAG: YfjI family protein [Planctomycetaceae bacterium]
MAAQKEARPLEQSGVSQQSETETHRSCDAEQIANWLKVLVEPNSTVETRTLFASNADTQVRHYSSNDLMTLASDALRLGKGAKGVYFLLNPLPAKWSGAPAKDADIVRRRWLPIDCDPKRKGTVSATDEEKDAARKRMVEVDSFLDEQGWPAPVIGDSGNGYWLLYLIDLPADDGGLVHRVLQVLASKFNDEAVSIDTTVGNASRIGKLFGTLAAKGEHTTERPHRVSKIIIIPDELTPVPIEMLQRLASESEKPQQQPLPLMARTGDAGHASRPEAIEQARKYLAAMEPSIQGQHGSNRLIKAASVLVNDFSLTDGEASDLLMAEFNPRCEPPWPENLIRRKIDEAKKNPPSRPAKGPGTATTATRSSSSSRKNGQSQNSTVEAIESFRTFPVDVLPAPLAEVVRCVTKAMGCDPSFVALPALSVLAGAIGNSRRIRLKRGWTEPVIIWTAIVGESGTLKSPPLEWLTQPLRDREESALERHATALEEFAAEQLRHAAAVAAWKQRKSSEPPPLTPVPPVCSRSFTSDATIEAVSLMLADNPRGMILIRDELAGWVSSFDQYKSKGGSDAAHWLSIHSAKGFVVDRKSGDRKTIFVPRPAMSATGGVQPATLRSVLAEGHVENGLAARLLFAYPPRHPKQWTEADISPAIEATWKTLIDGLFALESHIDENAKRQPIVVGLTPAAKAVWITFYNEHAEEQANLSGDLAAAWSKLECYAARLALVVHCVRVVSRAPSLISPDAVDESSIGAGITLARWFGHEARRVYAMLAETEDDTDQRQLVEWIRTRGRTATARELQRGPRRFQNATAEFAESELDKLVKAGHGVWEPIETTAVGGQPTRRFRLQNGDG